MFFKNYKPERKLRTLELHPPQILALGFLTLIIIGSVLLYLPISTTKPISFLNALFTATSATTVTGLVVVDTGSSFTFFGQIIILLLIQIGGLGFMSFAIIIIILLGKKIGLKQRLLVQEALNHESVGGVVRLVKIIVFFSLGVEFFAAFFLSLRWVPEMGLGKGVFYSIFHVVSAYNNAGFALWPDSLSKYVGDPIVNLIITFLFITGGLGFTVLTDLWFSKGIRHLSLHSKLMITGTLIINVTSIILFFLLEYHNPHTLGHLPFSDKLLASYFQGVTPRTAGFNTVDIGSLRTPTVLMTIFLMFIGAGSGSTASGIKVTTLMVIILSVISFIRGKDDTVVFNRTIRQSTIMKSIAVMMISLSFIIVAVFLLAMTEQAPFIMILFEVVSAFGTVGLSMGLTAKLSIVGKLIIMFMMFLGRVGPLTLAFSLSAPKKDKIRFPNGDVFTG